MHCTNSGLQQLSCQFTIALDFSVQIAATQGALPAPAPCRLQGRLHLSMIYCLSASADMHQLSCMLIVVTLHLLGPALQIGLSHA